MYTKPVIIIVVLSILIPLGFFFLVKEKANELSISQEVPCEIKIKTFEQDLSHLQSKLVKNGSIQDWKDFISFEKNIETCLNSEQIKFLNQVWVTVIVQGLPGFARFYHAEPDQRNKLEIEYRAISHEGNGEATAQDKQSLQDNFFHLCKVKTPPIECESFSAMVETPVVKEGNQAN